MTKRTDLPQLNTPDINVRFITLPLSVEGVSIPNDDGTFDIYINAIFDEEKRKAILMHELTHLHKDHFYIDLSIHQIESEANQHLKLL